MKFNYVIATGDSTISGSIRNILHKNQNAFLSAPLEEETHFRLDENGNEKEYPFFFDDSIITGSKCSLMSFNSQTMLESETFSVTDSNNKSYYIVSDSGNYIVDVENSRGKIIFDPVLDLSNEDVIFYDKRTPSSSFVTGKTSTAIGSWNDVVRNLLYKIDDVDVTADTIEMEEKYFLFFNGQKVVSFDSSTDLDDVTGIAFAIRKESQINEVTGIADIYGNKFVENHVDFYLNGMEQDPKDFIQTNTGVYMIETGVDSSVFLINQQIETYTL